MKSLFLALALAASSFAQITPFPGSLDTPGTLAVAADNVQSALTAPMQIGDTTAQVVNATRIPQWSLVTFGAEIARVCLKSGNTLTFGTPDACPSIAGRGLSATTIAPHSVGVIGHLNIDAYHQLAASSAIIALERRASGGVIYVTDDARAACNGSTIDDIAINALIAKAMNGLTLRVNCTSAVKNIVIPTATPNSSLSIVFDPGMQWNCKNSDGSDCVSAISSTFGNAGYRLDGMKLVGPDTYGSIPDICATKTSGNGLRITGNASPRLHITNSTGKGFCGSGKAGMWLDNVEESEIAGAELQFNDIGFKTTNNFNANTVNKMLASQNASYGVYMTGTAINDTFDSLTVQSNQAQGLYCDSCVGVTFHSPHLEGNNTAATANLCTWTFDSATGNTVGNLVDAPQFQGANDQVCMKNSGIALVNLNTIFRGGVTSGMPRGFNLTAAPQQVIDGTIATGNVVGLSALTGFYPTGNSQYQIAPPCSGSTDTTPCYAFADNAAGAGFKSGMRWDGTYLRLIANGTPWAFSTTNLYAPGHITFTNNSFYMQTYQNKWLLYDGATTGAAVVWRDVDNSRQALRMLPGTSGPEATASNIFTGKVTGDKFSTPGTGGSGYVAADLPTMNIAAGDAVICLDCTAASPTATGGSPRWVFWTGTQWNGN